MASRLVSGMLCNVGVWPLRKPFQIYMVVLARKMLM